MLSQRLSRLSLIVLVALLVGCGAAPAAAPAATSGSGQSSAPAEKVRVAIILPSAINDISWSQSIYDGLVEVQKEMGGESAMEIARSEGVYNVAEAAGAIRDYATKGYDLVIAHGAQYGSSVFEIASDFPEVSFAWGTSQDTGASKGLKNVFAYQPLAWQGGYVNGVLAAQISKTGVMGIVGPVEAGDAALYNAGFKQGVLATKPDAKVNISYTGSFGDTALAAEAANTHIQAGADVLTGSAQQVVGAIGVTKEKNIYWFSADTDQSSLAPQNVAASQIYNWVPTIKEMLALRKSGTIGGKAFDLTFANEGLLYKVNPNVKLPDGAQAAVDAAIAAVKAGEVKFQP
jgi:basic membrane lipoprotein Med (substrate-binding protein (PBP1-ABC) superfamily)